MKRRCTICNEEGHNSLVHEERPKLQGICRRCGQDGEFFPSTPSHCKQCFGKVQALRLARPEVQRKIAEYNLKYQADPEVRKRRRSQLKKRRERPEVRKRQAQTSFRTRLRRVYGLTVEEHAALLEAHDNRCAICGEREKSKQRNRRTLLAVDHDHVTNTVRGPLCTLCNTGLGGFRDSPDLLLKAIVYIAKYRALEED